MDEARPAPGNCCVGRGHWRGMLVMRVPKGWLPSVSGLNGSRRPSTPSYKRRQRLVAEAGAYGDTLAADGATGGSTRLRRPWSSCARENRASSRVCGIGLKCALGHKMRSCFLQRSAPSRQVLSIPQVESGIQAIVFGPAKRVRQPASLYLFQTDTCAIRCTGFL